MFILTLFRELNCYLKNPKCFGDSLANLKTL